MSILSTSDKLYALRFLRLLTMPWEKTAAYKEGIVNSKGERIAKPRTSDEKKAYTIFHRLVFNVRRLIQKVPGGRSTIARYGSALYLIKEETGMSESAILDIISEVLHDIELNESTIQPLTIGESYRLKNDVYYLPHCDVGAGIGSLVHVNKSVGEFDGIPMFEATRAGSNAKMIISAGDVA